MNYGYIRVDSVEGSVKYDILSQEGFISRYCKSEGIELDDCIYEDCGFLTPVDLRRLGRLLNKMQSGDRLICRFPGHLSHDLKELEAIREQCKKDGIILTVLSELHR